jgi:RNA-directed DNA polymerase
MIDRCKQALVKLALEPEWEVRFEAQSYGFRPGRSTHDAIAAIQVALGRQPLFVFNADIEAAFDHLNQAVLLDKLQTYPALRRLITAWLTAGVLDGETYSTSETGIAQGGVLSPLLMNIALHGMEAVVTENSANRQSRERPFFVRYADNFLIVHADLNTLQQAIKRVKHWLVGMGLHLHPQKTHIAHTLTPYQGQVGFDFLGFHIHQEPDRPMTRSKREQAPLSTSKAKIPFLMHRSVPQKVKTIIVPSQEANKRHRAAIEHKLQRLHLAPQARVIMELNPLIVGWSAYYTGIVDASIMHHYDDLMEQQLMKWASRRHPGKAQDWLLASYWHKGKSSRTFATPDGKQLRRYQHTSFLNGARF